MTMPDPAGRAPRKQRVSTRVGAMTELEFERRLLALGYTSIMRPVRYDAGVDFVVWTARGWRGVQVKTMNERHPFAARYRSFNTNKPREYYVSRGVDVFAVYRDGGFFIVPISECSASNIYLNRLRWTWEAWEEVLGSPASAPVEPDGLEQMYLLEN